jgi:hypothetical protein
MSRQNRLRGSKALGDLSRYRYKGKKKGHTEVQPEFREETPVTRQEKNQLSSCTQIVTWQRLPQRKNRVPQPKK